MKASDLKKEKFSIEITSERYVIKYGDILLTVSNVLYFTAKPVKEKVKNNFKMAVEHLDEICAGNGNEVEKSIIDRI